MEGGGRRTLSGKVQNLPGMMSYRQHSGDSNLLRLILRRRMDAKKPSYRLNLLGHYGCVNAIEFSSKGGEYLASDAIDLSLF